MFTKIILQLFVIFSVTTTWAQSNPFGTTFQPDRADPVEFYLTDGGVGIQGYDPVAYFTSEKATKGNPAISTVYGGVEYHFSSEDHKQMFLLEPNKYEPTYGGFCAWARAFGSYADADPLQFSLNTEKTRLHLFINKSRKEAWDAADKVKFEADADLSWYQETKDNGTTGIGEKARGIERDPSFYTN